MNMAPVFKYSSKINRSKDLVDSFDSCEHNEEIAAQMLISITRLVSNPIFICTAYSCLDHQLFEAPSRTVKQSKLFPHLEQRTINTCTLCFLLKLQ